MIEGFVIRRAVEADVALILGFIRKLAAYERLADELEVTEERLSTLVHKYANVFLHYAAT
jgi:hypothetical protein